MMPFSFPHLLATVGLLAATKKASGSPLFIVFIVIILGVYLLFIGPQRRRQRAQAGQQRTFEVGDEVVTTGGIYGRVEGIDGDRVELDIADGVVIEVARSAIARQVTPPAPEVVEDTEEAEASGASGDHTETAHDWSPPVEEPGHGVGANGHQGPSAGSSGDWVDPWASPPAKGEGDVPPAGGSS